MDILPPRSCHPASGFVFLSDISAVMPVPFSVDRPAVVAQTSLITVPRWLFHFAMTVQYSHDMCAIARRAIPSPSCITIFILPGRFASDGNSEVCITSAWPNACRMQLPVLEGAKDRGPPHPDERSGVGILLRLHPIASLFLHVCMLTCNASCALSQKVVPPRGCRKSALPADFTLHVCGRSHPQYVIAKSIE